MATSKDGKPEIRLPGFFTCEQAAKKLRMEADTIRRYVHRRLINAGIVGNQYLISADELERFRQNRRGPGRPRGQKSA